MLRIFLYVEDDLVYSCIIDLYYLSVLKEPCENRLLLHLSASTSLSASISSIQPRSFQVTRVQLATLPFPNA